MKQLAYITQGHSEYDPKLLELLDATGIDKEEFAAITSAESELKG